MIEDETFSLPRWQTGLLRWPTIMALAISPLILFSTAIWVGYRGIERAEPILSILAAFTLLGGALTALMSWWVLFRADIAIQKVRVAPAGLTYWPLYFSSPVTLAWSEVQAITFARVRIGSTSQVLRIALNSGKRRINVGQQFPGYERLVARLREYAPQFSYAEETGRGLTWMALSGPVIGVLLAGFNIWRWNERAVSPWLWVALLVLNLGIIGWMLIYRGRTPTRRESG
jgi:hypothetical protein